MHRHKERPPSNPNFQARSQPQSSNARTPSLKNGAAASKIKNRGKGASYKEKLKTYESSEYQIYKITRDSSQRLGLM